MNEFLKPDFQVSITNGSRATEKFMSCKTAIKIKLSTNIVNSRFLGPTVMEVLEKGVAALLNCATPLWINSFSTLIK